MRSGAAFLQEAFVDASPSTIQSFPFLFVNKILHQFICGQYLLYVF